MAIEAENASPAQPAQARPDAPQLLPAPKQAKPSRKLRLADLLLAALALALILGAIALWLTSSKTRN